MIRLNRIYTKAGDGGTTRLVGGQKIEKSALRLEAYGTVDELSACIGLARSALLKSGGPPEAVPVAGLLKRVQNELFNLGSDLATLIADRHPKQPRVEDRHVLALEAEMDEMNQHLPELRSFVLPGGGPAAAHLHLARTVCRRAERATVRLSETEEIGELVLPYLNRLSDFLFVLSRHVSRIYGEDEPLWEPEKI